MRNQVDVLLQALYADKHLSFTLTGEPMISIDSTGDASPRRCSHTHGCQKTGGQPINDQHVSTNWHYDLKETRKINKFQVAESELVQGVELMDPGRTGPNKVNYTWTCSCE